MYLCVKLNPLKGDRTKRSFETPVLAPLTSEFRTMSSDKTHLTIEEVNRQSYEEFIHVFGGVIESGQWFSACVYSRRPFTDVLDIHQKFGQLIDELPVNGQAAVLMLLPDLAGRLASLGGMTKESNQEHQAAGLDTLTTGERALMNQLNDQYKRKFGFPFVICARENKKKAIMQGLKDRFKNDKDVEIRNGIEEVKKICKLRLLDLIHV